MRIELITTGSELVLGFTVNTHVNYLARQLGRLGLRLTRQTTIGDERAEMRAAVAEALERADLLLVTGGLGPTRDDCTREVVAELLGRSLDLDQTIADRIRARYQRRGLSLPDSIAIQACVPQGAVVLPNHNGTAPGLQLAHHGKQVFLLPGPPRELKPMFEESVLPVLQELAGGTPPFECRVFKVVGLAESVVEQRVAPAVMAWPSLELGYSAKPGEVEVRIITPSTAMADQAEAAIRQALGHHLYGREDDRLEEVVIRQLAAAGRTVAVAESCTGGLICHRLTNVSGSSTVFLAGCVTYSNESKQRLLGVSAESLAVHGAVSEAVAREMAHGVRERHGTDFGLGTTGIAGPSGGTTDKPVGLVYLALATPHDTVVQRQLLNFDRETFKWFAAQYALDLLRGAGPVA